MNEGDYIKLGRVRFRIREIKSSNEISNKELVILKKTQISSISEKSALAAIDLYNKFNENIADDLQIFV